uniref:Divalent-cation tolerance protein CutA n=1 Tax=Caenorhabditis tropicalis TaxID=1561998 RepID=A0A1I7T2D1_9PELO
MTTPAVKMIMVYVTTPSKDIAMTLARTIVGESLAACANVIPGATSVYQWKGNIEECAEHVVILKTVESKVEDLSERVRSLHPAETPCFVAIPIEKITADFGEWIIDSTKTVSHN